VELMQWFGIENRNKDHDKNVIIIFNFLKVVP
jgi:hypothetical protein